MHDGLLRGISGRSRHRSPCPLYPRKRASFSTVARPGIINPSTGAPGRADTAPKRTSPRSEFVPMRSTMYRFALRHEPRGQQGVAPSPTCQRSGPGGTRCLAFPHANLTFETPVTTPSRLPISGRDKAAKPASSKFNRLFAETFALGPHKWAQCSELAADNRLVGSSSPSRPTTQSYTNRDFAVGRE
jgi:hypothetical protein